MAWQGVDLHYRKWWPVFLQEEGYFCLPRRWKAALWLVKAGLKEAQLLCVNWFSQAKGVFNRAESCSKCGSDHPPWGPKIAKLKHRDTWQMCLEVTRGWTQGNDNIQVDVCEHTTWYLVSVQHQMWNYCKRRKEFFTGSIILVEFFLFVCFLFLFCFWKQVSLETTEL